MKKLVTALSCVLGWSLAASANINLELRPPSQSVAPGDLVNIGLYVVSDHSSQSLAAAQVLIGWNPEFLVLLGIDGANGAPSTFTHFASDPYGINEVIPPQDGDGLYVYGAPLPLALAATPMGRLVTTFQFKALASTPQTPVCILESVGTSPVVHTTVFDAAEIGNGITGSLTGCAVKVVTHCYPGADLDCDGDVDLRDFAVFQRAFAPVAASAKGSLPAVLEIRKKRIEE